MISGKIDPMKYSIFLLLLFISIDINAQKKPLVILSTTKTRVLYCCVENTVEVMVEGSPNKKFSVQIDKGDIKKTDRYHYEILPTEVGMRTLTVVDDKGVKLLEERLMVKAMPPPMFVVGGKAGGSSFTVNQFRAQGGVVQLYGCLSIGLPRAKVTAYTAMILRNDVLIVTHAIKGNAFSEELRKSLNDLQVGDKVVFENIEYQWNYCTTKSIAEGQMAFTIE
jgi:hypothetical protein